MNRSRVIVRGLTRPADVVAGLGAPQVQYASTRPGWVLHWVARYLTELARARHAVPARVTHFPWLARRQVIHFGGSLGLDGPFEWLNDSNLLYGTWYHGHEGSLGSAFDEVIGSFVAIRERLAGVVVSSSTGEQTLTRHGFDPAVLHRIPLGVDTAHFRPADAARRAMLRERLGLPAAAFCVGSFQKDGKGWGDGDQPKLIKGPDVLLAVAESLRSRLPRLHMVLTGPARGYVRQGLGRLGVPYIHACLDRYEDVADYFQACDVCLITSRDEGGPMAFTEAWASGVPVVSTRMGMPADWIRDRVNGRLTEVDDVAGLAEAVLALAGDPESARSLAAQALLDVRALDWSEIARQHCERLYIPALRRLGRDVGPVAG